MNSIALAPGPADLRAVVFEQGNAEAPDSPGGAERVRIATDGSLEYEQRWGAHRRVVRGRVDPAHVLRILEHLARTAFPTPVQLTFLPGGSVCTISVEPSGSSIAIDYNEAMKLDGYRDVMHDLDALNSALRTTDRTVLARWQFEMDSAGS